MRKRNHTDQSQTQTESKKALLKRKPVIIGLSTLLVLVLGSLSVTSILAKGKDSSIDISDITVLQKETLTQSISATGTVESNSTNNVYSSLTYVVDQINVEVGDSVKVNDVLAVLDKSSLEDQIATKELNLSITKQSGEQQIKTAQDNYNATKSSIENSSNSSIVSAKSSLDTAYSNWQKAKKTYEDYLKTVNEGTNSTLIQQNSSTESALNAKETAEATKNSAETAYQTAKSKTDAAKTKLDAYSPDTSSNQANYDAAKTAYDGAVITQEIKQTAYDSAATSYQSAQNAYIADPSGANQTALTSAKASYDTASSELTTAKANVTTLKEKMDSAQQILLQSLDDTYVALKAEYDALKAVSDSAYEAKTKADKAYETAVDSYNYAALTKNAAYVSKDTTLNDYAIAEDNAYASYVNAQKSYDSANESLQNTLTSNKNSVNSAKISSDTSVSELELIQLQEDLAATEIKAPVDGIVTAVYAKVGSSGSGLLFVIEDTKNLVVDTTIKEYDIETVKTGMEAEIKSDATGEAIYKGVIETIAPTSNKTSQGETDKSGDIVFASKVSVLDSETKLRIGMNVRLNYIVNKKEDTLSVPYEAVFDQDETLGYILKLEKDGNSYSIRKVSVTIELENDIAIAVSGADLNEGDMIINNPQDYEALVNQKINVNLSTTDKEATNVSSSWKGTK